MYQSDDYEENQKSTSFYATNKKIIWLLGGLIILVILVLIFSNIGGTSVHEEEKTPEFEISEKDVSVEKGKSKQLNAAIKNYPNAEIIWQSDDSEIVTVNQKTGLITGKNLGKTSLKLTYIHEGNTPMYEFINVTVFEGNLDSKLLSSSFPPGDLMMSIGSTYDLNDKIITDPDDGYIETKEFSSSNPSIVQIDEDGIVQARSSGESVITVKINDTIEESIKVYVLNELINSSIIINPESISFVSSLLKVKLGEIKKLEYTVTPSSANLSNLVWQSSDENVVSVSNTGEISALAEGSATLMVKAVNGVEGKILIEVEKEIIEVQSVSYSQGSIALQVGNTFNLIPDVTPSNASNKSLTFSSSNESVASVVPDAEGLSATIYAFAQGSSIITFESNNGNVGKVTVNVSKASVAGGGSNSGSGSESTTTRGYNLKTGSGRLNNTLAAAKANPAYQSSDWIQLTSKDNSVSLDLKYCTYLNGNAPCTPYISVTGTTSKTINVSGIGVHVLVVQETANTKKNYSHYLYLAGPKGGVE